MVMVPTCYDTGELMVTDTEKMEMEVVLETLMALFVTPQNPVVR